MSHSKKTLAAAVAALTLCNAVVRAAPAAAFGVPGKSGITDAAPAVTQVYGGRRHGGHGGWGRGGRWQGPGAGIAILGGVILGGALVASAIAEHRVSGRDMRRCSDDFPNFDPRSGTYEARDGEIRVCPYLH